MVAKGNFVATHFFGTGVQGTPPQIGTKGAGIGFLPCFKNHMPDIGAFNFIRNAFSGEIIGKRGIICLLAVKARVQR